MKWIWIGIVLMVGSMISGCARREKVDNSAYIREHRVMTFWGMVTKPDRFVIDESNIRVGAGGARAIGPMHMSASPVEGDILTIDCPDQNVGLQEIEPNHILAIPDPGEDYVDYPFPDSVKVRVTSTPDVAERWDVVCLNADGEFVITEGEPLPVCTKEAEHSRAIELLIAGYLELVDPSVDYRSRWNPIYGEIRSNYVLKIDGVWKEVTESECDTEIERLDKLKKERIAELRKYRNDPTSDY